MLSLYGYKVTYGNDFVAAFINSAECNDTLFIVIVSNPGKAFPRKIKKVYSNRNDLMIGKNALLFGETDKQAKANPIPAHNSIQ